MSKFQRSIESFPKNRPSLSPCPGSQGVIPGIPLTWVRGMLKGFKYLERNYLMCSKFYHY